MINVISNAEQKDILIQQETQLHKHKYDMFINALLFTTKQYWPRVYNIS